MKFNDEMEYDFEKLRKVLVAKTFSVGALTGTHGDLANCTNAYDASPEQLIAMARRKGINLEKYKLK